MPKSISQLKVYVSVLRVLSKGYLPTSLLLPMKLKEILNEVKKSIPTTNPDYDIIINRLHLYYDMRLVTFGINEKKP